MTFTSVTRSLATPVSVRYSGIRLFSGASKPVLARKSRYGEAMKTIEDRPEVEALPNSTMSELARPGQLLWMSMLEVQKYIAKLQTEVPKLADKARPFQSPVKGCELYVQKPVDPATADATTVAQSVDPNNPVLRFRTSEYTLEDEHSHAHSVVLTVNLPQLKLNAQELHKLRLLVQPHQFRFESNELVLGCNEYPSSAQNKEKLIQIFQNLLKEVKKHDDMFTDVSPPKPSARRLRKYQLRNLRFPAEWAQPVTATPPKANDA
ncbi:37S ribosomal protein S24, mitochondrial [Dispira parvispora]|uniref:37S ribosomal protein S24, mitochondrial n=1 Tax=Dispira parvispora TaxID=1520584 RepID=A0A9W8E0H9_9FUNG|nr:37S ribosomal protein S24, mitochondrial [Dispira parvispora]